MFDIYSISEVNMGVLLHLFDNLNYLLLVSDSD